MILCDNSLQLSKEKCLGQTETKLHPRAIWGLKIKGESEDLRLCPECTKVFVWLHLQEVIELYFVDGLDKI
jgi:hypothetical protein